MDKKNIVLGVTGGIAAYKSAEIISRLKKENINVDVIMTKNAQQFITPLTLQSISYNKVVTDMFEILDNVDIEHISLAKKADILLIAPATANIIAKIAHGIADDMLSTVAMATKSQIIIAPAMNTNMYFSASNQKNMNILKDRGVIFIEPKDGLLACNDIGKGKLEDPEKIVDTVLFHLNKKNILSDKNILVTAGPTKEIIDPVRYITNRSTGKMGYAIAKQAALYGANVTLITGTDKMKIPCGVTNVINVETSKNMYDAVMENYKQNDIIIKSAAVADYKPKNISKEKIKKTDGNMFIELDRTNDILFELGNKKLKNQILIGFAAETNNVYENAIKKLIKKNLDFIVVNDIKQEGAGFGLDTNVVTIIDKNRNITEYPEKSKDYVAEIIIKEIINILK